MAAALPLLLLLHALGAAANVTYCWGSGSTGQLGDGQGGGSHTQPMPTAVLSGPEFAAVRAGDQHTCGLTAAGQAYCWVSGSRWVAWVQLALHHGVCRLMPALLRRWPVPTCPSSLALASSHVPAVR